VRRACIEPTPAVICLLSKDCAVENPQFYAAFVNYHTTFDECLYTSAKADRAPEGLESVHARGTEGYVFMLSGRQPCWKVNLTLSFLLH
jgi:hypothetical protein